MLMETKGEDYTVMLLWLRLYDSLYTLPCWSLHDLGSTERDCLHPIPLPLPFSQLLYPVKQFKLFTEYDIMLHQCCSRVTF